ncbi:cupredoxin domain-containing protein [Salinarchaeum laminariae]|uniref:cupredoxin domain-containing protein n=1 Tax=Salinarchaeum laminariae TaxID=869888 RepID=UPI0020BE7DE5|nr:plastocyanin/azurin family copper-binding protein [Salinarchaeum laminariae]
MHRRAYLASVGGAIAATSGCFGLFEGDYDVGMSPTDFEPQTLTVEAGTEVVWKNTSSRGHTVTAYENAIPADAAYFATGGFESQAAARDAWNTLGEDGIIGPGQTFSYTFEIPGRYEYFCIPHESEKMFGSVVVEE